MMTRHGFDCQIPQKLHCHGRALSVHRVHSETLIFFSLLIFSSGQCYSHYNPINTMDTEFFPLVSNSKISPSLGVAVDFI